MGMFTKHESLEVHCC